MDWQGILTAVFTTIPAFFLGWLTSNIQYKQQSTLIEKQNKSNFLISFLPDIDQKSNALLAFINGEGLRYSGWRLDKVISVISPQLYILCDGRFKDRLDELFINITPELLSENEKQEIYKLFIEECSEIISKYGGHN
jgi:hypothetical protein